MIYPRVTAAVLGIWTTRTTQVGPMAAGTTGRTSLDFGQLREGLYQIQCDFDPTNQVTETDEFRGRGAIILSVLEGQTLWQSAS